MIFYCNLVIFFKACISRKSVVSFLTFHTFFKEYQTFLIRKKLLMWIIAWRSAPTERTSASNLSVSLFAPLCCSTLIAAILAPWQYFHFLAGTLQWKQNHRQQVVNWGALRLCAGLSVRAGVLTKIPLTYNVSHFNVGCLELFWGG